MATSVQTTLVICITILLALWMLRSAIHQLTTAEKENFTFAVRFFGAGMWLFRGDHRPTEDAVKGFAPAEESSHVRDQIDQRIGL